MGYSIWGGAANDNTEEGGDKDGDKEDDDDDTADDPYELLDPVDILERLPKNFFELVEEKKWQLRKEALDALLPLSQTPKISSSGDYNELIRVLKKFISKDANVMIVTIAAQCLAGIAKGSIISKPSFYCKVDLILKSLFWNLTIPVFIWILCPFFRTIS